MIGRDGWVRAALALASVVFVAAAAAPAEAQQILAQPTSQNDKARISGFAWRSKSGGVIDVAALNDVPGFDGGVDVADQLGLTDSENGWILEANVAPGRRHRFIFELSRLQNSGEAAVDLADLGIPFLDLTVVAQSTIELREAHGYYNFLFVARPQVEAGAIIGVGYFDVSVTTTSSVARATAGLDQPFPVAGANLLINPQGPVRAYLEFTGFPKITVEDLSGWQADLVARVEVFPIRNLGFVAGYRRYRLVFDHDSAGIGLDLMWDGFTFGAQARF